MSGSTGSARERAIVHPGNALSRSRAVHPDRGGRHALYRPRAIAVSARDGVPRRVGSASVETLREQWLVEDRWWTPEPLRRRYFELVLADGRCVVVFRDLVGGGWFEQRA